MSFLAISGMVCACVFGGALLGLLLRAVLPAQHLSAEPWSLQRLDREQWAFMTSTKRPEQQ